MTIMVVVHLQETDSFLLIHQPRASSLQELTQHENSSKALSNLDLKTMSQIDFCTNAFDYSRHTYSTMVVLVPFRGDSWKLQVPLILAKKHMLYT